MTKFLYNSHLVEISFHEIFTLFILILISQNFCLFQPQSVEEIGEANLLHKSYQERTPEMLTLFENADRKNKVLSKWTKEQVEHVHRIGDTWDNFTSLMDNHEDLISRQVE